MQLCVLNYIMQAFQTKHPGVGNQGEKSLSYSIHDNNIYWCICAVEETRKAMTWKRVAWPSIGNNRSPQLPIHTHQKANSVGIYVYYYYIDLTRGICGTQASRVIGSKWPHLHGRATLPRQPRSYINAKMCTHTFTC